MTIQIAYDMLFKHCSTCGLLSHEKEYCPSVKETSQSQAQEDRIGVFQRVQDLQDNVGRIDSAPHWRHQDRVLHRDSGYYTSRSQGQDVRTGIFERVQMPQAHDDRSDIVSHRRHQNRVSHRDSGSLASRSDNRVDKRWYSHSDRLMRRRDEPRPKKYAANRHAPYAR